MERVNKAADLSAKTASHKNEAASEAAKALSEPKPEVKAPKPAAKEAKPDAQASKPEESISQTPTSTRSRQAAGAPRERQNDEVKNASKPEARAAKLPGSAGGSPASEQSTKEHLNPEFVNTKKDSSEKGGVLPKLNIDGIREVLDKGILPSPVEAAKQKLTEVKTEIVKFGAHMDHHMRTEGLKVVDAIHMRLDGTLSSADGKQNLEVKDNRITNAQGKEIAEINPLTGKLKFLGSETEQNKDINSYLNQWKFEGTENLKLPRTFDSNSSMSEGRLILGGETRRLCQVRMGMVIDNKTGEQIAKIDPPRQENGKLVGGSLTFINGKELPLNSNELAGTAFELTLDGQTGKEGRAIRGYCEGSEAGAVYKISALPGGKSENASEKNVSKESGIIDLDAYLDSAKQSNQIKQMASAEEKSKSYTDVSRYWNYFSGEEERLAKDAAASKEKLNRMEGLVTDLLSSANVDASEVLKKLDEEHTLLAADAKSGSGSESANEASKQNDADAQAQKASELKQIEVPALSSEKDTALVNGRLRIGQDLYEVREGKLYSANSEVAAAQLMPGYHVKFNDGRTLDLATENRVLFEYKIDTEPSSEVNKIVGLGATKKLADGSTLTGGLLNVKAFEREAAYAEEQAVKGNLSYYENKPVLTSWVTDPLIGGRQNVLEGITASVRNQRKAVTVELEQLFNEGFTAAKLDNNRIDQNLRATSNFMRDLGLSAQDSAHMAETGLQSQHMAGEAMVIAATSFVTMGVGSVLAGMVKAGRLSTMAAIGTELKVCTVAGGTTSALLRHTRSTDAYQVSRNFTGGMFEGLTMAGGGILARGLAEARTLVPIQRLSKELGIVNGAGATTLRESAINFMAGSRTAELGLVAATKTGSAFLQTTGFSLAGAFRQTGEEAKLSNALAPGKLLLGTMFFGAGDAVGGLLGSSTKFLTRAASTAESQVLRTIASERLAGSILSNQISRMPAQTATMFTFSGLSSIESSYDMERKNIAQKLGRQVDQVGFLDVMKYADKGAALNDAITQGAMTAIFTPFVSAGHGMLEYGIRGPLGLSKSNFLTNSANDRAHHNSSNELGISKFPSPYFPDFIRQAHESLMNGKCNPADIRVDQARVNQFIASTKAEATKLIESRLLEINRSPENTIEKICQKLNAQSEFTSAFIQIEKNLNECLKDWNLPPVELKLQSLPRGVGASYSFGKVALNTENFVLKKSINEVLSILFHEVAHHAQFEKVIRQVLDEHKIGDSASPEQLDAVSKRLNSMSALQAANGQSSNMELMIRQVIEMRNGRALSPEDSSTAKRLIESFTIYPDLEVQHPAEQKKMVETAGAYKNAAVLAPSEVSELITSPATEKTHWWGSEITKESIAKSSELAARLNALPESSSRTYLRSLLAQRGNEIKSTFKDMYDSYMGLPEVDAFLNTELILDTLASQKWARSAEGKSRQAAGAPGEEPRSELQTEAGSRSRSGLGAESKSPGLKPELRTRSEVSWIITPPSRTRSAALEALIGPIRSAQSESGPESKVFAFTANPQVEKSRIENTTHSEFVESNAYLSRLQEIASDPASLLDGIKGIVNRRSLEEAIKKTAASVQERTAKDPLTLPVDLFGDRARSFAWSVLWESLRQTGDFDQWNNIMQTRNINENEISAALIAHSVGQPLSTYPTLESIITKLCPRERVAMFSMPFEALNGGLEPVSFPVSMDIFNHHFGREIQPGVRVVDPPHIYKSHIVWEFFNGRLPEGMYLARTESRLAGKGLEFTLDYDKAHKTGRNGLPTKFRKPIKIVVERVDTDQGSRWQYKTHYERD